MEQPQLRKVDLKTGEILAPPQADMDEETRAAEEAACHASDSEIDADMEEVETDGDALTSLHTGTAALVRIAPGKDNQIIGYAEDVLRIQRYAEGLTVTDLESDKRATEDVTMVKKLRTDIEAEQKAWLAPLKEHEKVIRDAFALLLGPLDVANQTLRDKIVSYRQAQAAIRKAEEEPADLQRQANEAAVRAARASGVETVELGTVPEVVTPEVAKTLRTDIGASTMTTNWKWRWKEGLSMAQIMAGLPEEYKMPNETKIGQVVRAKNKAPVTEADFGGMIEIYPEAGLRITEKGG